MKPYQIDRLAATAPATIDSRQRRRLEAHVDTASRCEARIQHLRAELERTLATTDASVRAGSGDVPVQLSETLTIVCELDTLERVQPRVDAWLSDYVAGLVAAHVQEETYGDGEPV